MKMVIAEVRRRFENEDGAGPGRALLTPLYLAGESGWTGIVDIEMQFPYKGEVVWWNPPSYVQEGCLFVTTLVEGKVTDERHAKYRVESDFPFYNFVEMRGEPDETELRRKLASGGFTFSQKPLGRILLELPGVENKWLGPLDMQFKLNSNSRWESGPASSSGFVPVRIIENTELQIISIHETTIKCLRPRHTLGGNVGKFSAQSDRQLIESLLKRLRKIDAETLKALDVTKEVFHGYVKALSDAKLIDTQDEIEHVREEALEQLMGSLNADSKWAYETATALIKHPNVRKVFDSAVRLEVEKRAEQIQSQAKIESATVLEQVDEAQNRLEEVEEKIARRTEELEGIIDKLKSKDTELKDVSLQLADQLSGLVSRIMSDPVQELGKSALVRALSADPIEEPPLKPEIEMHPASSEFDSLDECIGSLNLVATMREQNLNSLLACMAALLSGTPIVIVGEKSIELCTVFCELIARSYAAKINLPTTIFSLSDFFELPVSPVMGSGFLPMTLANYFDTANNLDACFPLVLVGVNRAPMETALLDVLIGSSSLNCNQVAVLSGEKEKPRVVKIERSAFFMMTLLNGESTFRLHPSFERVALFIDADRDPASPLASIQGEQLPDKFISLESMKDWGHEGREIPKNIVNRARETPNWSAGEFGSQKELGLFCRIFSDEKTGMAEWLYSKYAYSHSPEQLSTIARSWDSRVAEELEKIMEGADINRIKMVGRAIVE